MPVLHKYIDKGITSQRTQDCSSASLILGKLGFYVWCAYTYVYVCMYNFYINTMSQNNSLSAVALFLIGLDNRLASLIIQHSARVASVMCENCHSCPAS